MFQNWVAVSITPMSFIVIHANIILLSLKGNTPLLLTSVPVPHLQCRLVTWIQHYSHNDPIIEYHCKFDRIIKGACCWIGNVTYLLFLNSEIMITHLSPWSECASFSVFKLNYISMHLTISHIGKVTILQEYWDKVPILYRSFGLDQILMEKVPCLCLVFFFFFFSLKKHFMIWLGFCWGFFFWSFWFFVFLKDLTQLWCWTFISVANNPNLRSVPHKLSIKYCMSHFCVSSKVSYFSPLWYFLLLNNLKNSRMLKWKVQGESISITHWMTIVFVRNNMYLSKQESLWSWMACRSGL